MNKKILIIIGIIVIIGIILGISINKPKDENTFILGMDDSFPPMGYRNENNELVGFDIDLANEVCKKPRAAKTSDKIYNWTWNNLKVLINGGR